MSIVTLPSLLNACSGERWSLRRESACLACFPEFLAKRRLPPFAPAAGGFGYFQGAADHRRTKDDFEKAGWAGIERLLFHAELMKEAARGAAEVSRLRRLTMEEVNAQLWVTIYLARNDMGKWISSDASVTERSGRSGG